MNDINLTDIYSAEDIESEVAEDIMKLPDVSDVTEYAINEDNNVKSEDFNLSITYKFPNTIRNNRTPNGMTYGSKDMTFKKLYQILCERFNGGEYFIDDYFNTVYPYTVKSEVDRHLQTVKDDLVSLASDTLEGAKVTKRGTLDKRYKVNRSLQEKLRDYESFASLWEENEGLYVAKMIKDDIISCMLTGQLQTVCIQHINTISTKTKRMKVGLPSEPTFVATQQLIRSLQLFVNLGGNKQWKTKQGILV